MGCVSSNLLNHEDEFTQLGSSALSHHIVSLTSSTYGLLTLDPPQQPPPRHHSSTPTTPPLRFKMGSTTHPSPLPPEPKSLWADPSPMRTDPEVINSWELMAGLDADSFRFSNKENSNPNPTRLNRVNGSVTLKARFEETAAAEKKRNLLDRYGKVCPPNGEGKVVIYTTTLRGVRKTFEACNAVRAAIEATGVIISERDVSMDRGFRDELRDLMKEEESRVVVLPQIFVKGRYVGGVEEILRIAEEGLLLELFEGLPKRRGGEVCEGCGNDVALVSNLLVQETTINKLKLMAASWAQAWDACVGTRLSLGSKPEVWGPSLSAKDRGSGLGAEFRPMFQLGSRERSGGVENDDDWDDYYYYPQTQIQIQRKDDIEEANKLQNRKEASFKREKALAYAFSHQIWRNRRNPSSGNEEELEERSKWLDRWMATKQWENTTEQQQRRDTNIIRTTLELDTYGPNIRKQQQLHKAQQPGPLLSPNIPSPAVTPSPSKLKLLRPSSPRYSSSKEERCYSAAHTPNFGVVATCRYGSVPNYMASTESAIAKSRARTLSAPKQREQIRGSSGCGTNGSVRKRLYYPSVMDQQNDVVSDQLRSPSFKSLQNGFCYYNGMDQNNLNNSSSCYAESLIGRERDNVSACSTTDLRWLK
uniref:Glutaredoxin domain-containing protein n=1 Tax=Cannabis sativa TaxID=3483 RepID=A0A803PP99_CANSA